MNLNNTTKSQLTDFQVHQFGFLSYGGGMLALGMMEIIHHEEGKQKLAVNITTQQITNSKFISVNGGVGEMAVSPNGKNSIHMEDFVTSGRRIFYKAIDKYTKAEELHLLGSLRKVSSL
jgi:hypothetical protein